MRISLVVITSLLLAGCASSVEIGPGHRGLLFDPSNGGLSHEILQPGNHRVGASGRIDDFDVTYSSHAEPLHVISSEGLSVDVKLTVIYRPIIAELYELDTDIGRNYYDAVVGPEFRSASRACFARHSFVDLTDGASKLEDEIERDLRARIVGKHVEIASVTFESVQLPPEVMDAVRAHITAEQEAQKKKIEADSAWEREKIELEHNVERQRLLREANPPR